MPNLAQWLIGLVIVGIPVMAIHYHATQSERARCARIAEAQINVDNPAAPDCRVAAEIAREIRGQSGIWPWGD